MALFFHAGGRQSPRALALMLKGPRRVPLIAIEAGFAGDCSGRKQSQAAIAGAGAIRKVLVPIAGSPG